MLVQHSEDRIGVHEDEVKVQAITFLTTFPYTSVSR